MTRIVFWALSVLLLAAVVHLAYVLFVPKYEMRAKIDEMARLGPRGALTVLSREQGERLMGPDGRWLVHALCVYDLSAGPITVSAAVPKTYWSMTIYSAGGETFYSLNDRQAGIDRVTIVLRQARERIFGDDQDVPQPEGDVLTVRAPERTGLVVMRALAGEAAEYGRIAEVLAGSSCRSGAG